MILWYSWFAYFGLIFGLVASGILGTPLLRSALIGFAIGMVLVTGINAATPQPAPCLQTSKGWDIVRSPWICK